MEFGYYTTCYYPDVETKTPNQLYKESVDQMVLAEDLGFTSVSIPEHHFINYLTVPSPLLLATKVAERTKSIPIITAVLVLPFYEPLRLAGEIALTDHLTDGRLQLGLGRGAFKYEFDVLGLSLEESRGRFSELVELLDKLLSQKDVTYEGQYYNVVEPITIMPESLQRPRPPFWMAVITEGAIRWAVQQGHNVLTTPLREGWETTKGQATWFVEERDKLGKTDIQHCMVRNLYVSKDRKDLEAKAELLYENHRRFTNLFETPGTVDQGVVRPIDVPMTVHEAAQNTIFGTPDEVIERLKAHEELGIDIVHVNMAFGADHADITKCQELFAEEVMPEFRSAAVSAAA
jgi:alkanesulfonate monooxygenase SsuD/methylene tetrahydromethanopterin reductase-like flavin-dependent oxidoreductase (luciferase family)